MIQNVAVDVVLLRTKINLFSKTYYHLLVISDMIPSSSNVAATLLIPHIRNFVMLLLRVTGN